EPRVNLAMLALLLGGVSVAGVAIAGAARVVTRPELGRRLAAPLLYSGVLALSLMPYVWKGPQVVATKPTYAMPAVLLLGLLLMLGLETMRRTIGTVVRALFLVLAAGGAVTAWYGWWAPDDPPPRPVALGVARPGSAVEAVERYFRYRADDPIRAAL